MTTWWWLLNILWESSNEIEEKDKGEFIAHYSTYIINLAFNIGTWNQRQEIFIGSICGAAVELSKKKN